MDRKEAAELIQRYLKGECTPEEAAKIEIWYNEETERSSYVAEETDYEAFYRESLRGIREGRVVSIASKKSKLQGSVVKVAATVALLLVSLLGMYYIIHSRVPSERPQALAMEEIGPGGSRATLTLADGRRVDLSEGQHEIVVNQDISYADGSPVFNEKQEEKSGSQSGWLMLSTPKGGTYQVRLPDGSQVWLNASTVLKYPRAFSGKYREVEISGEAFFSVVKDSGHPFRVISPGQEIHVLGTEFNISAYADEPDTRTTLVSGSVEIHNLESKQVHRIKPGMQSMVKGGDMQVLQADVDAAIAWKSGKFIFSHKPFAQVMRELSRWYDIRVVYEGSVPDIEFFGGIHRDSKLSSVVHVLEDAAVSFTMTDERTLVVKQKKGGLD